jgi:outer membrane protein TolC
LTPRSTLCTIARAAAAPPSRQGHVQQSPRSAALLLLATALGVTTPVKAEGDELDLAAAYALALERSESTRIAETAVDQADTQVWSAWAQLGPTAQLSASGELNSSGPSRGVNPFTGQLSDFPAGGSRALGATASVNQPLFRRGFFDERAAGARSVEASRQRLARERESVLLEVATAFIGSMRARRQVETARTAVQRAEGERASIAARVSAGGALRSSLVQAGLSVRRAESQVLGAQRAVQEQEVTFARLIGVRPPRGLRLPQRPLPLTLEQALERAAERGDFRAAKQATVAAAHRIAAARGGLWPRLDARLDYRTPSLDSAALPDTYGAHVAVGSAQLVVPLFQTGAEHVREASARLEARVAELQERQLWKLIEQEVALGVVEVENARLASELADRQLAEAKENYDLVTTQFKLRTVTFLEVANAQASLTEAESAKVTATFDGELAAYRLLHAAGSLSLP